jgi:5-formyltetrahydrofolate cyclo-ligase
VTQGRDKPGVRAAVLAARRALTGPERAAADAAITDHAIALVRGRSRVAGYLPMVGEPGGPGLVDALAAQVEVLLLPVLCPDRDLDWACYDGSVERSGAMSEPTGPRLGVDAITGAELLLVPAVAVDGTGVRLGRGGGSYDRALARVRAGTPIVALLYEGELRAELPAVAQDRPVTGVITPSGLWLV